MKILLDLLPVIAFFAAFKIGKSFPDPIVDTLSSLIGPVKASALAAGDLLPVAVATAVAIVASVIQISVMLLRRHPIKPMTWISAVLIVVFGGLTLWLQNAWFIKWKPTLLYLAFAAILAIGKLRGRNLLGLLLGDEIVLPVEIWDRLLIAWTLFFMLLAVLNLIVAYSFSTDGWVNFKTFGLLGLTLAFSLGTATVMARHAQEAADASPSAAPDA